MSEAGEAAEAAALAIEGAEAGTELFRGVTCWMQEERQALCCCVVFKQNVGLLVVYFSA